MTEEQKTEGCSESACSSCSQAGSCSSKKVDLHEPANAHSSIGKVIGVVSGMQILQDHLFLSLLVLHEKSSCKRRWNCPCILDSKNGIKVMSLNLLMEKMTDPVIWRGPVIAGLLSSSGTEVDWDGTDLDYLFVGYATGNRRCVSPSEAHLVAMEFYQAGYNVFVLEYTVNPLDEAPLKLQPLNDISGRCNDPFSLQSSCTFCQIGSWCADFQPRTSV